MQQRLCRGWRFADDKHGRHVAEADIAQLIGNSHHRRFDIAFGVARGSPGDRAAQGGAPALDFFDFEWRLNSRAVVLCVGSHHLFPLYFLKTFFKKPSLSSLRAIVKSKTCAMVAFFAS